MVAKYAPMMDNRSDRQTDRQGRNEFLDIIKYLAIFLVVWGHVIQQTSLVHTWPLQEDPLMRLIYTMHMPLFMGLCGYFFCLSMKKCHSASTYIKQKLMSRLCGLFIPMISFGLFKVLIDFAMGKTFASPLLFLKGWFGAAKGIWFLGDLAVNTMIVLLVLPFCKGCFKRDWKYFLLVLPLTLIPHVTYQAPHMYLYFVFGYWIAAYMDRSVKRFLPLFPYAFVGFIVAYVVFCNLPWPPEDVWFDYHHQSVLRLVVNDSLKIFLGVAGSFLALVLGYYLQPYIKGRWLYRRATCEGRFTLDIYLLQIIIVEKLAGPWHKNWVACGGMDLFNFNFAERVLMTFIVSVLFMECLVMIRKYLNRSRLLRKILFYRG